MIKGYIALHSCQILSPLGTGFIVSVHKLTKKHPVDLDSYTVVVRAVADLYP